MKPTPESIATSFYTSFQQMDAEGMNSHYHPKATFKDPVFGNLDYTHVCGMWQMLCESAADLKISFSILSANDDAVITKWLAEYTFSKTNRFVHNEIVATMIIEDGKIIEHTDSFGLHKWAKQALGLQGFLLGSTAYFANKLKHQTTRQLERYLNKQVTN